MNPLSPKICRFIFIVLLLIGLTRLIGMALLPLADTTEARYGEIARKMVETGNWVTPQFDYGVPFWAKPPLSTWLSAASMGLFGVNEFSARLPSFLICLGILWLIYRFVASCRDDNQALMTVFVLASMVLFFITAGAVMTDACLMLSTTIAMIAFWQSTQKNNIPWGYIFFIALAIGLLAKGPLVFVLTGLSIVPWLLWKKAHQENVWEHLPWVRGTLLMLVIAVPWYVLAESRTPGFLNYFIMGEHIKRFTVSGWQGDLYGHAHAEPLGMVWIYFLVGLMPWPLLAIASLRKRQYWPNTWFNHQSEWILYLLLWGLGPMVFFTFAHNIIPTYPLTGLPACAILGVEIWQRNRINRTQSPQRLSHSCFGFIIAALFAPLLMVGYIAWTFVSPDSAPKPSEKQLVTRYLTMRPSSESLLVYWSHRYHSAEFYSRGKMRVVESASGLEALLQNGTRDFIAIPDDRVARLPQTISTHFVRVAVYNEMVLFEETAEHTP